MKRKACLSIMLIAILVFSIPLTSFANVSVSMIQCPQCGYECEIPRFGPWEDTDDHGICDVVDPVTGRTARYFIYYQARSVYYTCANNSAHTVIIFERREKCRCFAYYLD